MCFDDCSGGSASRRFFLQTSTAALAAAALTSPALADLDVDLDIRDVVFPNAAASIRGFLARPVQDNAAPALIIIGGNPGIEAPLKAFALKVAAARYCALIVDLNSRVTPPTKLDHPIEFYRSNAFDQQVSSDIVAAMQYLRTQPFVEKTSLGMIGFCGGGRKALVMAAQDKSVKLVVAFYAPARMGEFRNPKDPMIDALDVAGRIQVPVQAHYGLLDKVALPKDARELQAVLRRHDAAPVEFFFYEGAGHGFCDYNWKPEQAGAFGYNAAAARLAEHRALLFIAQYLR
jgi:carboxymethylenebutenolidase